MCDKFYECKNRALSYAMNGDLRSGLSSFVRECSKFKCMEFIIDQPLTFLILSSPEARENVQALEKTLQAFVCDCHVGLKKKA